MEAAPVVSEFFAALLRHAAEEEALGLPGAGLERWGPVAALTAVIAVTAGPAEPARSGVFWAVAAAGGIAGWCLAAGIQPGLCVALFILSHLCGTHVTPCAMLAGTRCWPNWAACS